MHLREIDVNLIVVFDALLIDASVTKAAERLGRSPSAMSHALARLREIFNDELFVRAGQKLVPTARAEQLAPTVHILISGIESLLRPTVPFDPAQQDRSFVISAPETYELVCGRELKAALNDDAPGIELTFEAFKGEASVEAQRLGEAQFVIVEGDVSETISDFSWQTLYEDRYQTICRSGHKLKRKISRKEFANAEHIVLRNIFNESDPFFWYLREQGFETLKSSSVSSLLAGLLSVLESDRLITLPARVMEAIGNQLEFTKLEQPFPSLNIKIQLGWHRRYNRDECHMWVRDLIKTRLSR